MPAQIQFQLTPGPDGTGNSISISASGYTAPSTIAIYALNSETEDTIQEISGCTCVADGPTIEQAWPTPTPALPRAAYIATIWNNGATPQVAMPMPGFTGYSDISAWVCAGPAVDSAEAETILNAGVEFGERIQSNGLKRSANSIPTPEEAMQELVDLGVPASYFSEQAMVNLGQLLNDLEQDPNGKVSPKAGAWSCWSCKVGFGIVILAIVAAIVLIIMVATGGAGALATTLVAYLATSSISAVAANSAVLGGALAGMAWTGGASAISAALLAYLPNKLCQLTKAC